MRLRFILIAFVCLFSSTPSLACSFDPNAGYDDPLPEDAVFGIAEVVSIAFSKSGDSGSCMTLDYSTSKSLMGVVPDAFSVKTCNDRAPVESLKTINDEVGGWGFVSGATVLLGLIPIDGKQPNFRYYVPDSCGWFHYRLDTLSEEERSSSLDGFKKWLTDR
ncbi:MAG: hypothetical protein ABJN26_16000 [Stappiaceae bacterium]